jgi:hypothetical protein
MICDYCEAQGYKRLFGRDHAVTYKMVERTGFAEDSVKALLESTGLWPRVLKFDTSLVKKGRLILKSSKNSFKFGAFRPPIYSFTPSYLLKLT